MQSLKNREHLQLHNFPYEKIRENQRLALEKIQEIQESAIMELPTGSGKTAIGYTFLKNELADCPDALGLYIVPNKSLVNQVHSLHPETKIVYGRNEYPCYFYESLDKAVTAEDAPCSMLDCPHRIDMETGETKEENVEPCPYLWAKCQAAQGGIVVCTMAFYIFSQFFGNWKKPKAVVIDEAHQIARVTRGCLNYKISSEYLKRGIEKLKIVNAKKEAEQLHSFLQRMIEIGNLKPMREPTLLAATEIQSLVEKLKVIDVNAIDKAVHRAMICGIIDPVEDDKDLKTIENVIRNVSRYLSSFKYSAKDEGRHPLNYVFSYYEKEKEMDEKTKYYLNINAYYVAPIIRACLSDTKYLAYSATISRPDIFGNETGLKTSNYYTFPSEFSAKKTKIFLPNNTANLAMKTCKKNEKENTIRQIVRICSKLAKRKKKIRSLVVVISNDEKEKFVEFAKKEKNFEVVSYGNGVTAKEAVTKFRDEKQGDVLLGTVANYGEGLDLPNEAAPVIFFLRPGYPSPKAPSTQFEEQRFAERRWPLWNWRVTLEALQVRGRNIRSAEDLGVCFFISQQFKRFVKDNLPEYLLDSVVDDKTLEQCVEETIKFLK